MSEQKDRPEICRDCSRYETDCQGSNQEDCARRLDRPDREKILGSLLGAYSLLDNTSEPSDQQKEWMEREADKILALFPDIEEAKREEKNRILALLKKEYPAITTWQCWEDLKGGK